MSALRDPCLRCGRQQACWNYEVMGSQRSYLEGSIDDRDDADDVVDTI